jgi:hypothetical protein
MGLLSYLGGIGNFVLLCLWLIGSIFDDGGSDSYPYRLRVIFVAFGHRLGTGLGVHQRVCCPRVL